MSPDYGYFTVLRRASFSRLAALAAERPLQIVGAINAYCAMLAHQAGFHAIYLSGAGVANASYGMPDLGITTLNDVLEDVRRITAATSLPLLVDADTGWGGAFSIARTVREMTRAGAAGIHLEDQVQSKRCGHRPGKALVNSNEMGDRIKAAVDARIDIEQIRVPDDLIQARSALERAYFLEHALIVAGCPDAVDHQLFAAARQAIHLQGGVHDGEKQRRSHDREADQHQPAQ